MVSTPKIALITGAVSGIGKSVSSIVRAERLPVVLAGRRKELLGPIASEFGTLQAP